MTFRSDDTARTSTLAFLIVGGFVAGASALLSSSTPATAVVLQTSAVISICGNGIIDTGETCDDGVGNNTGDYGDSPSTRICSPDCLSFGPYCGDGILQARFGEECDNGSGNGGTSLCSMSCKSVPAVPASTPTTILGSTPYVPGASPGTISAQGLTQVVLRGKAFPNAQVHILLDGKAFADVLADSNADFLYNTTVVPSGTATFSLWAKDAQGVDSLTTSVVFQVVQSAITNVNNIFIPPTLVLSDKQVGLGGYLTLSGQSVPAASVVSNVDADTSNALAATVDASGAWGLQLDAGSLSQGYHTVKAFFKIGSQSRSGYGKSLSFYVGTVAPTGKVSPDMNHDGKVNLVDFSIFLLSWGTSDVQADFNEDGKVNLADFSIMLFAWTG